MVLNYGIHYKGEQMITIDSWIKLPRENMFTQVLEVDKLNDRILLANGGTVIGIKWANEVYEVTDTKGACERALQLINSGVYRPNQFDIRTLTAILSSGNDDTYFEYEIDDVFSYIFKGRKWYLSLWVGDEEIQLPLVVSSADSNKGHLMCCCYNRFLGE